MPESGAEASGSLWKGGPGPGRDGSFTGEGGCLGPIGKDRCSRQKPRSGYQANGRPMQSPNADTGIQPPKSMPPISFGGLTMNCTHRKNGCRDRGPALREETPSSAWGVVTPGAKSLLRTGSPAFHLVCIKVWAILPAESASLLGLPLRCCLFETPRRQDTAEAVSSNEERRPPAYALRGGCSPWTPPVLFPREGRP